MMLAPISLFVAFLALMAKWLLTLSSYVVAPLMLYIFGCGKRSGTLLLFQYSRFGKI